MKKRLCTFLTAAMLLFCIEPATEARERNPATNWMSEGVYGMGLDYAAMIPNLPRNKNNDLIPGPEFNKAVNEFDIKIVEDRVDWMIREFDPAFIQIGYFETRSLAFFGPNPVVDEMFGLQPGEGPCERDLIGEILQLLKSKGIRTGVYFGAYGFGVQSLQNVIGWTSNRDKEKQISSVCAIFEYYSRKYGDLLDFYWIDSLYDHEYTENDLKKYVKAAKAGNPDRIICMNNGADDNALAYVSRNGLADFTAGEHHLINYVPSSRWVDNAQFQIALPLSDYNHAGSFHSIHDICKYVKDVGDVGGAVNLSTGIQNRSNPYAFGFMTLPSDDPDAPPITTEIDPVMTEMMRWVRKVVRDGEPLPFRSFDGVKRIEAEHCTSMKELEALDFTVGTFSLATIQAIAESQLCVDFETFFSSYKAGDQRVFVGVEGDDMLGAWAKYKDVRIPKEVKQIAVACAPSVEKEFVYRLEVRLDGLQGQKLASFEDVGGVDWWRFVDEQNPITEEEKSKLQARYELRIVDVEVPAGTRDVFLVNHWNREGGEYKPFDKMWGVDYSQVINPKARPWEHIGPTNEGFFYANGFSAVFRDVDFGDGMAFFDAYTAMVGGPGYLELYVDAPNEKQGTLLGKIAIYDTGWYDIYKVQSGPVKSVTGVHDLYLIGAGNLGWFRFRKDDKPIPYEAEGYILQTDGRYKGIVGRLTTDLGLSESLDRQTAAMLAEMAFGWEHRVLDMTEEKIAEALARFEDAGDVSAKLAPYAAYAVKKNMLPGIEGKSLEPKRQIKGGELCELIMRTLGQAYDGGGSGAVSALAKLGVLPEDIQPGIAEKQITRRDYVAIIYNMFYNMTIDGETAADRVNNRVFGTKVVTIPAYMVDFRQPNEEGAPSEYPLVENPDSNPNLGYITQDLWWGYKNVNFGSGANTVLADLSLIGTVSPVWDVILDDPNNEPVGKLIVPLTGGWHSYKEVAFDLNEVVSGVHDVYLKVTNAPESYGGNIKSLSFSNRENN